MFGNSWRKLMKRSKRLAGGKVDGHATRWTRHPATYDSRIRISRAISKLIVADAHDIALFQDGAYAQESDMDGLGLCPYDPRHNSTAVFVGELHSNVPSYLFPVETSRLGKLRPRKWNAIGGRSARWKDPPSYFSPGNGICLNARVLSSFSLSLFVV